MDILDAIREGLANSGSVSITFIVAIGVMVLEGPTLTLAAVLASLGEIPLASALIGAFLGVLAADSFFFTLGRFLGGRILASSLLWRLFGPRIEKVQDWVTRYGTVAMFATRFLPGTRTAAHAAAGALGMAWAPFLSVAALAALIYVHLIILLIYAFGPGVAEWFESLGVPPVLGILVAVLLVTLLGRLFTLLPIARRRHEDEEESTGAVNEMGSLDSRVSESSPGSADSTGALASADSAEPTDSAAPTDSTASTDSTRSTNPTASTNASGSDDKTSTQGTSAHERVSDSRGRSRDESSDDVPQPKDP